MSASLTVSLDDTGTHTAVLSATNKDGSTATDVSVAYSTDNAAVCDVDPSSGLLKLVSAGSANITGTGTRGTFSHADSGTVTVTPSQDFGVSLTLS